MSVKAALSGFVERTMASYPRLLAPFDSQWRSPCEIGEPFTGEDGPLIAWQPLPRHPDSIAGDFAPLERALDREVHPDIKTYYGAYWSAGLEAEAREGHVSLLFLWNQEDIARLNENLIGHAFSLGLRAGRKPRRPMSIFFACTDPESELFLSIDNDSGTVLLERPGGRNVRQVADSLAGFLEELVPAPPVVHL